MISANFIEYFALALALAGLAAVVWEIAVKDAGLFGEIVADSRAMAESRRAEPTKGFAPIPVTLGESANNNEIRKAA
jgi:hypothetical protein